MRLRLPDPTPIERLITGIRSGAISIAPIKIVTLFMTIPSVAIIVETAVKIRNFFVSVLSSTSVFMASFISFFSLLMMMRFSKNLNMGMGLVCSVAF